MMTVTEMKEILFEKLQDEGTSFTKSEINIKKNDNDTYTIVIEGYEHSAFKMSFEKDDYFGFIVWVYDSFEESNIIFLDNKKDYDIKRALIRLGYHIGRTF